MLHRQLMIKGEIYLYVVFALYTFKFTDPNTERWFDCVCRCEGTNMGIVYEHAQIWI